ncbi:B-box-type zinc finger [Trinorchestia longiramus]|nr:B-box-type zinc finger [Trinorchestia longiramus]
MSSGSPTPSLESLSGTPIGSLIDSDPTRSMENSPPVSTTSELLTFLKRKLGSVAGPQLTISTNCPVCNDTFTSPRVLHCLHAVCLHCLEKIYDGDKITCPACHNTTETSPLFLIPDYAMQRLVENSAVEDQQGCTSCKRDIATSRCLDCSQYLCSNCLTSHDYMNGILNHTVVNIEQSTQDRAVSCVRHPVENVRLVCVPCRVPICADCAIMDHPQPQHQHMSLSDAVASHMESFNKCLEASRAKAQDLRVCIKSIENSSCRMMSQYEKARTEITTSYNQHMAAITERRNEMWQELDNYYNNKQQSLATAARKAQDSVDAIWTACDFVEKLKKYATPTELLMHRRMIEARLVEQVSLNMDVGLEGVSELEFVTNYPALQQSVRNSFGYIRSSADLQGPSKMGPIARPNSSVSSLNNFNNTLNSLNGLAISNGVGNFSNSGHHNQQQHQQQQQLSSLASQLGNLQMQQQQQQQNHSNHGNFHGSPLGTSSLASTLAALNSVNGGSANALERVLANSQLNYFKRYGPVQTQYSANSAAGLGDLNLNSSSGYEKWSHGDDVKFSSLNQFPPRSQIKRQKMIYHCKFGEFGILEGQFTEPSGVAVNAQNDIIVADTNNHRIQIFDKEGRFKFQFGECGKRDGQLLYPNRVAVVRTSGDIIVTERSPTHQIQIYNQYGQFVRKFGASTLCYPRGVTVDSRGRIIVVECKVMRVIIFDQFGTVLHQFNCPNHLEFPNGCVVNDKQEIFISDNRAHCVKVFNYDGQYLRQIGGEGITNYPIGVGLTTQGEVLIADNHNNFNLTLFTQDGNLVSAYESKVKHAQCFDVALMDDGSVVLASKDYRLYVYRYLQVPPHL